MVNEKVDMIIEDTKGNVIFNETVETMPNGFIDLWLPRDKTFNITISKDGKKVEQEISTFKGDNTCITNMQLL